MKIARTFTIDYMVAQELKELKNQSSFVNAAIKSRLAAFKNEVPELTWQWYQCPACNDTKKGKTGDSWVFCECDEQMKPTS